MIETALPSMLRRIHLFWLGPHPECEFSYITVWESAAVFMCRSDREDRAGCHHCTSSNAVNAPDSRVIFTLYDWQNQGNITALPLACLRFTVRTASRHRFHLPGRRGHTCPRSNGASINQSCAQTSVCEGTTHAVQLMRPTFGSLDAGVLVVAQEESLSTAALVAAHHVDANLLTSTVAFRALVHICQRKERENNRMWWNDKRAVVRSILMRLEEKSSYPEAFYKQSLSDITHQELFFSPNQSARVSKAAQHGSTLVCTRILRPCSTKP